MNFKQKREEFERRCGGKENIHFKGKIVDKRGEKDEYRPPNCVCGQKTKRIYKIGTEATENIHWVGTCCITEFRDVSFYIGKYGVNQRSYKTFVEGIKHEISPEICNTPEMKRIVFNLECSFIKTPEDIDILEGIIGCKVRFLPKIKHRKVVLTKERKEHLERISVRMNEIEEKEETASKQHLTDFMRELKKRNCKVSKKIQRFREADK